jgi:hypothetical protein
MMIRKSWTDLTITPHYRLSRLLRCVAMQSSLVTSRYKKTCILKKSIRTVKKMSTQPL